MEWSVRGYRPRVLDRRGNQWRQSPHGSSSAAGPCVSRPADTLPSHRARGDLSLPIHLKGGHLEACLGLGLPGAIRIRRSEQVHLLLVAGDQILRAGVARIDQVFAWQQATSSECNLDVRKLDDVGNSGRGGLDLSNEVWQLFVARLGHMHLVPYPIDLPLGGIAGFRLVGGVNPFRRCREGFWVAESQLIALSEVLLGPDLPQNR